ncbi:hypothetical protein BDW02DRAFT_509885 [Decorospora gaudefroyi]|uniref:Xylanolytic transcriptional activator regulatory domain-containing protein n=1 Tax=Decorospora gaudefroyi TaxID=184978 RepID=A0A6A5K7Y6_9PLEO|nr:hypothetical protein BDW02DRAFT_509885 [Decorospora gaudefroyi]
MRLHTTSEGSSENVGHVSLREKSRNANKTSVTDQCHRLARLLKDVRARASVEESSRIRDILDEIDEDLSEPQQTLTPSTLNGDTYGSQVSVDASDIDRFEHLETEALDLLDEDLHRDGARSTGFVGKSSEVQWLRAVALSQTDRIDGDWIGSTTQRRGSYAAGSEPVSSFSFWADCDDVNIDFYVDPNELPQPAMAESLVQCYMLKVHDSFPILPRKPFENQTRVYFTALRNGNAPRLSPKWQAVLNLVFAIGANYLYLCDKCCRADDHLVYQARARAFGLNEAIVTTHTDVPQIQSLGLLAFYWLSTGQVSRAWTILGVALRSAYALGLHVRNEVPSATAVQRESLVQTWWSLYSLERTLSIITGRPSIVVDSCCSVPLPMAVPEEDISEEVEAAYRIHAANVSMSHSISPTSSVSFNVGANPPLTPVGLGTKGAKSASYFRAVVQLSIISQSILTSLYSAGTMIRSAVEIQQDTALLSQRLDEWVSSLPAEFRLEVPCWDPNNLFARERTLLRFQLCSARILLTRPCLTVRRQPWKEASDASFSRRMADSCIEAAKTIVASLPDEPCPGLCEEGPWWCIVHHMMQSISVFLLALSYPFSTSEDVTRMVQCVRKIIRWLQVMKGPVAERAHRVALNCFQTVARRYSIDVSDLWGRATEAPAARNSVSDNNAGVATAATSTPDVSAYAAYDAATKGAAFAPQSKVLKFDDTHYRTRRGECSGW